MSRQSTLPFTKRSEAAAATSAAAASASATPAAAAPAASAHAADDEMRELHDMETLMQRFGSDSASGASGEQKHASPSPSAAARTSARLSYEAIRAVYDAHDRDLTRATEALSAGRMDAKSALPNPGAGSASSQRKGAADAATATPSRESILSEEGERRNKRARVNQASTKHDAGFVSSIAAAASSSSKPPPAAAAAAASPSSFAKPASSSSSSASSHHSSGRLKLVITPGDLFSAPASVSLAHCVSECLAMGKGIAVLFKKRFGGVEQLKAQKRKVGDVAVLQREGGRFVYYLITKPRYFHKPTYDSLRASLEAMRAHMQSHAVRDLAMPRIGCGLDGLEWTKVEQLLRDVFKECEVRITVYTGP